MDDKDTKERDERDLEADIEALNPAQVWNLLNVFLMTSRDLPNFAGIRRQASDLLNAINAGLVTAQAEADAEAKEEAAQEAAAKEAAEIAPAEGDKPEPPALKADPPADPGFFDLSKPAPDLRRP